MINTIPPALIYIVGALAIPLIPSRFKNGYMLLLPIIGMLNLLNIPIGTHFVVNFVDYTLIFGEMDRLARIFGIIFHLISFITIIYILNFKNNSEYVAGFIYAGCALGAIFAGDLISFFFFWESLTISSMFLILLRKTKRSRQAAFRYTLVHAAGGLLLLAGIVIHTQQTGSYAISSIGLNGLGSYLIFLGFGINCAWPFFHTWLTDAYPEATIGGAVFLSAFTTKTAVYALARSFPGEEPLIWIGTAMAAFPIFYAVIENDLRKVLAYSLINQVGFMVVGIGIGTQLAINGAIAHAFNDVIFKGLLFMSVGAVMYRTGKVNATDLGGLYKSMPITCGFCIVGAASISAFPLFSAFISKSMVMSAAAEQGLWITWFTLLFAAAGVFHHAGIKIPFFTFFGHDAGHRVKEAPKNMLIAMGIAAFLCIFIGSFPRFLYSILPFEVDYNPYTYDHVLGQLQLLFFSAMAFTLLLLAGIYPAEKRALNADSDWFYRKGFAVLYIIFDKGLNGINEWSNRNIALGLTGKISYFFKDGPARLCMIMLKPLWELSGSQIDGPNGLEERFVKKFRSSYFSIGSTAIYVLILLLFFFMYQKH